MAQYQYAIGMMFKNGLNKELFIQEISCRLNSPVSNVYISNDGENVIVETDGDLTDVSKEDLTKYVKTHNSSMRAVWRNAKKVSELPLGIEGEVGFAFNGRKAGEPPNQGTGCPVYFSGGKWRTFSDDSEVKS